TLDSTFLTVRNRENLYAMVDTELLWSRAIHLDERRGAVIIATYQYLKSKGEVVEPGALGRSWGFGGAFVESAAQLGFMTSPSRARTLLRAIVETILRVPQGTHALRTGSSGAAPQQRRGNALAWRRDIDREYHLHYWDGPDGCELANVVV